MSDRVVLILGIEQTPGAAPSHYFWLYLIEQGRLVAPAFLDQGAAEQWATLNGAILVDDWVPDELVVLDQVVAATTDNGAFVVCVTVYRGGRLVPNSQQPQHRYWIFRKDGTRMATRATLVEALGLIETPVVSSPSRDQDNPQSRSSFKAEG